MIDKLRAEIEVKSQKASAVKQHLKEQLELSHQLTRPSNIQNQPERKLLIQSIDNSLKQGIINDLINGRAYQLQKQRLETEEDRINKNMDRYRECIPSTSTPYTDLKVMETQTNTRPPDIINILLENDKVRSERRRMETKQVSRSNVYGKITREETQKTIRDLEK